MTDNINIRDVNGLIHAITLRVASCYDMERLCAYMTFDGKDGLSFLPNGWIDWVYGLKVCFEI